MGGPGGYSFGGYPLKRMRYRVAVHFRMVGRGWSSVRELSFESRHAIGRSLWCA
jgi:hypothetical protein